MNAIMNDERALATLQALANGTDPVSGATFPASNPYQHPDTVRALYHAIRALEAGASRPKRPTQNLPSNSGKPWSAEEDAQLSGAGQRSNAAMVWRTRSPRRSAYICCWPAAWLNAACASYKFVWAVGMPTAI